MKHPRRLRRWLLIMMASLFLVACQRQFPEVHRTDVPTHVLDSNTNEVNIEVAITSASSIVDEILPEAYLAGISYVGKCESVENLRGKLNIMFIQKRRGILSPSVWIADVSIDTNKQSMDIWTWEATSKDLITKPLTLQNGLSLQEIANMAGERLKMLGLVECDIMLSRLDESWLVVCTAPGSGPAGPQICEFRMDIETGKVISGNG